MCATGREQCAYINGQRCTLWPGTEVRDLLTPQEIKAVRAGSHEVCKVEGERADVVGLEGPVENGAVFVFRAIPIADSKVSGAEMLLDAGSEETTHQLAEEFEARGYRVHRPGTDADALELLRRDRRFRCYQIAVLHIDLLRRAHDAGEGSLPSLPVLALCPDGLTERQSMRLGARRLFRLPISASQLPALFGAAFAEVRGLSILPSEEWDRARWINENQERRRSKPQGQSETDHPTPVECLESTGIKGLDLVLGGGVLRFARTSKSSKLAASVLIQGRPGTGKTVLALQMARGLLRSGACGRAALYACVEPLPEEIRRTALAFNDWKFLEDHVLIQEDKGADPKNGSRTCSNLPRDNEGVLLIGSLNLNPAWIGESWGERQDAGFLSGIRQQLTSWLAEIRDRGVVPGVLVIDALSPGYRLGAALPRVLFDELVRLATDRGIVLILLHERLGNEARHFPFVTDVVLTLEQTGKPGLGRSARSIEVEKSRFTDTWPGSHDMTITAEQGIIVYPNLASWARRLRSKTSLTEAIEPCSIGIEELDNARAFAYGCTTLIHGTQIDLIGGLVDKFLATAGDAEAAIEIIVGQSCIPELQRDLTQREWVRIGFGCSGLPPAQALSEAVGRIEMEKASMQRARVAIFGIHRLNLMEPAGEYVQAVHELTAELQRQGDAVMVVSLSETRDSAVLEAWRRAELRIDNNVPTQAEFAFERPTKSVKFSRYQLPQPEQSTTVREGYPVSVGRSSVQ